MNSNNSDIFLLCQFFEWILTFPKWMDSFNEILLFTRWISRILLLCCFLHKPLRYQISQKPTNLPSHEHKLYPFYILGRLSTRGTQNVNIWITIKLYYFLFISYYTNYFLSYIFALIILNAQTAKVCLKKYLHDKFQQKIVTTTDSVQTHLGHSYDKENFIHVGRFIY